MSDFLGELAYWVPLTMIVWVLIWYIARSRRAIRNDVAFSTRDIATWPISLVLTTAGFLGLLFAGVHVAFVEGSWVRVVAVGLVAGLAVGLVPRLWARVIRPASPSSQHSNSSAQIDE